MSDEFKIERAVRQQALLRLAISAVSGAGKTKGSLRVARGIVEYMIEHGLLTGTIEGKIGVIDTERNSASLYANLYPFDRISLTAPYTVKRYLGAAQAMANAGKTVVIIDQISHQWAGQGGMLEFVDLLRARGSGGNKNEFAAWQEATPEQNEFLEGLLALPCHLICTLRAKTAYVMEEKTRRDGTKYTAPKRIGLKPIQREGVEYEFTTVIDLELETKTATVSKDRTELFVDRETLKSKSFILTEAVGKQLAEWLYEGQASEVPIVAPPLERAQATAASGIRQMEAAANVPDLGRIWEQLQKDLRGFVHSVERDTLKGIIDEATTAKDRCKQKLKPDPIPAVGVIDAELAVDLEKLISDSGTTRETALEALGVPALMRLPKGKLQAAVDWINEEALANIGRPLVLTSRLQAAGAVVKAKAGAFADMQDDLPWKD